MMQAASLLGLTQVVINDIQRIEYCMRSFGCMYRLENLPFLNTADRYSPQSASLVLVQYDTHKMPDRPTLLGLPSTVCSPDILHQPCSFTRVLGGFNSDCPFIFELIEPPLFEPLPVPIAAVMGSPFRWIMHVKLCGKRSHTYRIRDLKQSYPVYFALELKMSTQHTSASWFTSVSTLNSALLEKSQQNICLSILTATDLLSEALSNPGLTINLQLNVTWVSACYTFILVPSCGINFATLMTQLTKSHRLRNKTLTASSLLPWFYPHRRKWLISAVTGDAALDYSPTTVLRMLSVLLESKLGLIDAGVMREMENSWGLITLGPLTGMLVRFQLTDLGSNASELEAISSQKAQLNLLERAILNCAPHIQLDRVQTTATSTPDTCSKSKGLCRVIDCLLSEIECLTDLISRLIERTMRDRVPPIADFLLTLDGNLDLAHHASNWHAKAISAHLEPVGQTYINAEFVSCVQATEAALSRLCLATEV